jgi:hypothetical protein
MAGLGDLVQEIREASRSIEMGDARTGKRLEQIEKSVDSLFVKIGRPGASGDCDDAGFERTATEMCKSRHAITVNKVEEVEYSPSGPEIDQAINAQRGLRAYLRHGDMDRLAPEYRKGLSAFSFGPPGNFLLPPTQADRMLSCLVNPTDLSGLVDKVSISGPFSDRQRALSARRLGL